MPLSFPSQVQHPQLDKDALVKSGEHIFITEPPTMVDTQYGARIRVIARTAGGEVGSLMFGATTLLGASLIECAALMQENPGEEVGPVVVAAVALKGGKSTYSLTEPAAPASARKGK
jgi:hypothetical protein